MSGYLVSGTSQYGALAHVTASPNAVVAREETHERIYPSGVVERSIVRTITSTPVAQVSPGTRRPAHVPAPLLALERFLVNVVRLAVCTLVGAAIFLLVGAATQYAFPAGGFPGVCGLMLAVFFGSVPVFYAIGEFTGSNK